MEFKKELKKCLMCDNLVKKWETDSWRKYNETRKYCSLDCRQIWNKGLTVADPRVKAYVSKNYTKFKEGQNTGKLNFKWKGENASYNAKHMRIYRMYGKADKCTLCDRTVNIQWANISNQYKPSIIDWVKLCTSHHRQFDLYKKYPEKYSKYKFIYEQLTNMQNVPHT